MTAAHAGDPRPGPRQSPSPLPTDDKREPHARQPMVAWASPGVLQRSAIRALMAPLFGRFADKRELMGLASATVPERDLATAPIWVDFVADTGEGFDSTYTVARVVSEDRLPLSAGEDPDAKGQGLPRGKILLVGGDLVYPYAERSAYRDRFELPWSTALPMPKQSSTGHPGGKRGRPKGAERIFIIPGNHDWYDGLTAFRRAFGSFERRSIGNRRTSQSRSYFAVSVGHGWWMFGIDLQFDGYIDDEQMHYFVRVAEDMQKSDGPQRVVLIVPEPSWVTDADGPEPSVRLKPIEYFTQRVVEAHGHVLCAVLTGDLHHYSVYDEQGSGGRNRVWITCGGGGAHLRGTHDLPSTVRIERHYPTSSFGTLTLREDSVYPGKSESRMRGLAVVFLPILCPPVAVLLGLGAVLLAALLGVSGTQRLNDVPFLDPQAWWQGTRGLLIDHPMVALGGLAGIFAMALAADARRVWQRALMALPHALAHGLTFFLVWWAASRAASDHPDLTQRIILAEGGVLLLAGLLRRLKGIPRTLRWLPILATGLIFLFIGWIALDPAEPEQPADTALRMLALLAIPAGIAHTLVFGLYLASTSLFGRHVGPAFAAQSIPDRKCFLRMRVAANGLTIFPIGIDRVCRRWRWNYADQRYDPDDREAGLAARARALEDPIRVT